mmetsp:Transcript_22909/g.55433  ORF Transcript_22909/g.55433 Transcript_22909/m.55433 type:complete len:243 (-) Transcript_22909:72-800(-)
MRTALSAHAQLQDRVLPGIYHVVHQLALVQEKLALLSIGHYYLRAQVHIAALRAPGGGRPRGRGHHRGLGGGLPVGVLVGQPLPPQHPPEHRRLLLPLTLAGQHHRGGHGHHQHPGYRDQPGRVLPRGHLAGLEEPALVGGRWGDVGGGGGLLLLQLSHQAHHLLHHLHRHRTELIDQAGVLHAPHPDADSDGRSRHVHPRGRRRVPGHNHPGHRGPRRNKHAGLRAQTGGVWEVRRVPRSV